MSGCGVGRVPEKRWKWDNNIALYMTNFKAAKSTKKNPPYKP